MQDRRRKGQRYLLDVPMEYSLGDVVRARTEYLVDLSVGGMSFISEMKLEQGTVINISIPLFKPVFQTQAVVCWVRKNKNGTYTIGAQFKETQNEFRARMLRQVCHIQNYRKEVLEKESRKLTGEQAAIEWIEKYAKFFPKD